MAHIPYGYKIERGLAIVIDEQAVRIRSLYHAFLEGLSIDAAGKQAGIPLSRSAIGKILANPVYLGDGYYPQLIEETLFDKVQEERAARASSASPAARSRAPAAVPVQTSFHLRSLPRKEGDPVADAHNLYKSIEAMQLTGGPDVQDADLTGIGNGLPAAPSLLSPEGKPGARIRVIPASSALEKAKDPDEPPRKQRVAAYCRVSTDMEEQESSYEAQVRHYTDYIQGNPAWELAGIYADEGISGTDTKKRDEFNRMVDACMAGQIDLIITKSISRFARNTVDCLRSIRQLKAQQVAVYFEKENINTMDAKGEVLITIMASLAQQESQSISQNVRMGIHYQYQQGKVRLNHTCFLGYTKDADGNLVIVPEEADIVRRIFMDFLAGKSTRKIATDLNKDNIPTATGRGKWHDSTIRSMLRNEKYMGDALLQKAYTVDFLTKKKAKNLGELPQYYVENNHEPIISREIFRQTQGELLRREHLYSASGMRETHSCKYALSGHMVCSHCGSSYRCMRASIPSQNTIWRCKLHLSQKNACRGRSVPEKEVHAAVLQALNSLAAEKENFRSRRDTILQETIVSLQAETDRLARAILSLTDQLSRCAMLLEMGEDDPALSSQVQRINTRLSSLKSYKLHLSEKTAALGYEERQLTNMLNFIESHERDGTFVPEIFFHEDEMMLLLDQIRVLDYGYIISFKVGRVIEVAGR